MAFATTPDIRDGFRGLAGFLVPHMDSGLTGPRKTGIVNYADRKFKSLARATTVLLSTVLPSIAVLGLYYIDSLSSRLLAIIEFSASFSPVLALFTNARPIEIFTATASFAAVQVVFVRGTDPSATRSCECISQSSDDSTVNIPAPFQ
ncbi:hypothetical protein P154DRAFT_569262 [Amniculicola lignicola CBS 123094]|uniref:DUF6594 domain-containing protein n=1 Tax=Amniculicola lignicola CBS 123094 TaxID=1392246 RepID=A0A6A5X386_9PLEO|nr:hypothetical protein P154DRAFT_569262 [Amniculicola lignicola CBS 123094]